MPVIIHKSRGVQRAVQEQKVALRPIFVGPQSFNKGAQMELLTASLRIQHNNSFSNQQTDIAGKYVVHNKKVWAPLH